MSHITTELVEQVARARVDAHAAHFGSLPAADRVDIPDFALKTWEEQDKITQHGVRETVLGQLNEILPALLAAGWTPPEQANEIRDWMKRAPGGVA